MDKAEIRGRCIKIVARHARCDVLDIDDLSTFKDIGLDGLGSMAVVMDIEDSFAISITDMDTMVIDTFGDLIDMVAGKLGVAA